MKATTSLPETTASTDVVLGPADPERIEWNQSNAVLSGPIRHFVHDHPDQYNQYWTDRSRDGVVGVVQVSPTGSEEPVLALIAQLGINPAFIRFDHVGYSAKEVGLVRDKFTAEIPQLQARGIKVSTVGEDGVSGVVRVGIEGLSRALQQELQADYPNLVFSAECAISVDD